MEISCENIDYVIWSHTTKSSNKIIVNGKLGWEDRIMIGRCDKKEYEFISFNQFSPQNCRMAKKDSCSIRLSLVLFG